MNADKLLPKLTAALERIRKANADIARISDDIVSKHAGPGDGSKLHTIWEAFGDGLMNRTEVVSSAVDNLEDWIVGADL